MFLDVFFNIDNGYLEGLVRGFKSGILKNQDYVNLVQCETLEDLKLHLQTTDYGNFDKSGASFTLATNGLAVERSGCFRWSLLVVSRKGRATCAECASARLPRGATGRSAGCLSLGRRIAARHSKNGVFSAPRLKF